MYIKRERKIGFGILSVGSHDVDFLGFDGSPSRTLIYSFLSKSQAL